MKKNLEINAVKEFKKKTCKLCVFVEGGEGVKGDLVKNREEERPKAPTSHLLLALPLRVQIF